MSDLKIAPIAQDKKIGDPSSARGRTLILVLDINPNQSYFSKSPSSLLHCVDSALSLANSHLMLHPNNTVAAIAAHGQSCSFLYPESDESTQEYNDQGPSDGQFEGFFKVERTVRKKVTSILTRETDPRAPMISETLISGALCMALSYIHRLRQSNQLTGSDDYSGESRILVLSASGDTATQYMNYMNVFFSAQKMNVNIDTCMVDKDSGLLQQGADITGGFYHKISQKHFKCLLQFLIWLYLPDTNLRSGLSLPSVQRVDYRAACFCHRELIDVGYVCSVCLSIFCKFSPICSTCHTIFKTLPPMVKKKKQK